MIVHRVIEVSAKDVTGVVNKDGSILWSNGKTWIKTSDLPPEPNVQVQEGANGDAHKREDSTSISHESLDDIINKADPSRTRSFFNSSMRRESASRISISHSGSLSSSEVFLDTQETLEMQDAFPQQTIDLQDTMPEELAQVEIGIGHQYSSEI